MCNKGDVMIVTIRSIVDELDRVYLKSTWDKFNNHINNNTLEIILERFLSYQIKIGILYMGIL